MEHSLNHLWQSFFGSWGTSPQPVSRRNETRLPAHGAAVVRRDIKGSEADAVNLLGVSENGLSFRSELSLAPEQKILVEVGEQQLEAVVRHSAPDGAAFIIGAEIVSGQLEPSPAAEQAGAAENRVRQKKVG